MQSFLGFANFYYTFIKGFSKLTAPLTALVRFDHERETVVETDASGWCIGGILLQRDDDGFLRPCAFYSKKMLLAECNYLIYDKELLTIQLLDFIPLW